MIMYSERNYKDLVEKVEFLNQVLIGRELKYIKNRLNKCQIRRNRSINFEVIYYLKNFDSVT